MTLIVSPSSMVLLPADKAPTAIRVPVVPPFVLLVVINAPPITVWFVAIVKAAGRGIVHRLAGHCAECQSLPDQFIISRDLGHPA